VVAVRQALTLVEAGEGQFASGVLTALLEVTAEQPMVIPVWTGPESVRSGGRLTLAVLADLIGEAQREMLLVSYATLPSVEIRSALADAAGRGVEITTLLEREDDNPQFHGHGESLSGIRARRLFWPGPVRPPGAAMHAKVLVVDRSVALVGSANLTGYGLERHLECGLLVRGGPIPAALAEHLLHVGELQSLGGDAGPQ
jgi:phosphatidylserine/phosphatidylglycerophosphate/cardiolipin synthase-like enzyme